MRPWTTLSSTTLVDDRWMRLTADRCALPDGTQIEPYYVVTERDWVHVLALRDDGRVVVVRQFRYGAKVVCAELPGGVVDDGESPLAAARRELLEETGHVADDWLAVGRMYANPARQTNSVHVFVARGARQVAAQRLDETEEMSVHVATIDEVQRMIQDNDFSQALHIASFHRALHALATRSIDPEDT